MAVDAVVYYKIYNATMAITNVENASRSTRLLAQTTLRNVLGTRSLSEILSERETISHSIKATLDDATDPWGVKVERVEVWVSVTLSKGKWQQNFLSSHLKETPKQYIEVYYRILISSLLREIFSLEIFSCPPSWIFVDMHDTSQLGSRDFFSYHTMINMLS